MAAQTIDSTQGKFLVYCSKCGKFYLATPKNDIYELIPMEKTNINFISQPYTLKGEVQ
jgi:hypothetical protein